MNSNNVYCFIYLLFLMLFSCKTETQPEHTFHKYQLETDTCKSIQFLKEEKVIVTKDCGNHAPDKVIMIQKLNGEQIELYCFDALNFQVDSIDRNAGQYITTYDKNGNKCHGFHIIDNDGCWVVTPLKIGERINDHFTEPTIYRKDNSKSDFDFDKQLIIQLSKVPEQDFFYIAYGQSGLTNSKQDKLGNNIIRLQADANLFKTDLEINPSYYAFKKYQFQIFDPSTNDFLEVPVLYHNEYSNYMKMDESKRQDFLNQKGITDNFIVVYRFNPGRKRIVDKLYNEKINGQVQSFEFVRINE